MEVARLRGPATVLFLEPPTPERLARFAVLSRHRHRRRRALATARSGWTHICRRCSELLATLGAPVIALQGLLDLRLRAARRHHRPRDRHRTRAFSAAAGSRWWWAIRAWAATRRSATCSRVANGVGYRARPAPDHVAASGHADGRGRSRPASRQADEPSAIGLVDFVAMKRGEADARLAQRDRARGRHRLARRARRQRRWSRPAG